MITGMNPIPNIRDGPNFRYKQRSFTPSDFVGIDQLRILYHFVHKIQVSRIKNTGILEFTESLSCNIQNNFILKFNPNWKINNLFSTNLQEYQLRCFHVL